MKRPIPSVLSHIQVIVIFLICCLPLLDTSVVDAKIVFCIGDDIYVMDDNDRRKHRLTRNTETTKDRKPRWSPDGERIAFVRYMDKNQNQTSSELFIMNANGTNIQRLTDNNVRDHSLSWSPDGQRIVFTSLRSGRPELHVIDLATLHVTQLTDGGDGSASPDWSPDGTQIAFEHFTDVRNIYVMSANGEDPRPLIPEADILRGELELFEPRWSADGKRIVFDSCTWDGVGHRCHLTIVTNRGNVKHRVNEIQERFGHARPLVGDMCWMDNDKALLFELRLVNPKTSSDIYRYDISNRSLKRLTSGEGYEGDPDWIEGPLPVSLNSKKKWCGEH